MKKELPQDPYEIIPEPPPTTKTTSLTVIVESDSYDAVVRAIVNIYGVVEVAL